MSPRRVQHRLNQVMERNLRRLQRMEVIQEPIITQRNGRMVLLVKAEMRPQVPGIVHDVSDSGATVFVEPMPAIDTGNRWREVRLAEQREEERVLRGLSDLVSRQGEDLLLTLDLMARLDLAVAKGRYAAATRASCPVVSEPGPEGRALKIVRGRHPLLGGDVVPISPELGGDHTVMLITGPNAGGKTVALKTVGLLAMMAQAGLHVPADEARFPCFDGIYADIGDQQSIEHSLSTFSSHIGNLLAIMDGSTADSLLLVDELGASTDPEEGSALAKAILHHFQRQGLLTVATTHHRSVARYVQEQPGMINASVELDPETLDPTYHVTVGLPGRSYAVTIAARLGVPPEIIDRARQSLSPQDRAAEDLLRELQEERMTAEILRKEAEAAVLEAREQRTQVEEQLTSVEGSKVEILEETRRELLARIDGMLARFHQMEKDLDRPETPPSRNDDRAYLEEARREVVSPQWEPIEVQRPEWQGRIKKGDRGVHPGHRPPRRSHHSSRPARPGGGTAGKPCGPRCRCTSWNARPRDIRPRPSTAFISTLGAPGGLHGDRLAGPTSRGGRHPNRRRPGRRGAGRRRIAAHHSRQGHGGIAAGSEGTPGGTPAGGYGRAW